MGNLILLCLCVILTLAYNIYVIIRYKKIPESLSETSYLFGGNKRFLFTGYCILITFLLLPVLLNITNENFQILPVLICAGLAFAGCSPLFREGLDKKVHYISAYISFGTFVLYSILCMNWIYTVVFICILGMLCLIRYKSFIYFAEILALFFLIYYSFYTLFF